MLLASLRRAPTSHTPSQPPSHPPSHPAHTVPPDTPAPAEAPHGAAGRTDGEPLGTGVPRFPPLRVTPGRWHRLRRLPPRRRRPLAAALAAAAVAAALLAATVPGGTAPRQPAARQAPAAPPTGRDVRTAEPPLVSAPVRIADAATVRLLRPGDRVDVLAVPNGAPLHGAGPGTPTARLVARNVPVADIPHPPSPSDPGDGEAGEAPVAAGAEEGGLVLLTVPRSTAAVLTGAAATSRLSLLLR